MRYRPFGNSGAAVSALSLVLTDAPMRNDERQKLIFAALECGINTFELRSREPGVAASLGEALSAVERRMVFVAMRVGWSRDKSGAAVRDYSHDALTGAIETAIQRTGLGRLDVALLEAFEDQEAIPPHVVPDLQAAQSARRVGMLGIAGGAAVDPYLDTGAFEVLATTYSIQSGWAERNRLKRATQADMAIMGYGFQPFVATVEETADKPAGPLGLARLLRAPEKKKKPRDGYDFLDRTPGWSAEEICLGYALTEPALTTVQTATRSIEQLQKLAAITERDLPTGVAAQIEMARFSQSQVTGAA